MPTTDLIGAGWKFPVELDGRGAVALAQGEDEIKQAIRIILSTPVGSRVMRPEFGCRLHELVFAPMNASTTTAAARYVEEALGYWEPRIDVLDVQVELYPAIEGCLVITLSYRLRATYDERTLVFPFYTIPDDRR
ncbi:MAG: GPW/gp25 family protein [Chloroflexota bacterium]